MDPCHPYPCSDRYSSCIWFDFITYIYIHTLIHELNLKESFKRKWVWMPVRTNKMKV